MGLGVGHHHYTTSTRAPHLDRVREPAEEVEEGDDVRAPQRVQHGLPVGVRARARARARVRVRVRVRVWG